MKNIFSLIAFCLFYTGALAQYGRLEPIRPGDSVFVMRTPVETIKKLATSTDKNIKKKALTIQRTEKNLEFMRNGYLLNRLPTPNISSFLNDVRFLQSNGVDPNYYVQEFFLYYPRQ